MKKLVYLLLAFMAISCSQSNEDRIKAAFMEYAKNNLDDPSQLDEIVSIDSLDTISSFIFKEAIRIKHEVYKMEDSICDSLDSIIHLYFRDEKYKPKLRYIHGLRDAFGESLEIQSYLIDVLDNLYDHPDSALKKIMAHKDTVIYEQKLTYRLKQKDGLKLHSCYVYSDTLYNNIIFSKTHLRTEDSPFVDLIQQAEDYKEQFEPLFMTISMKEKSNRKILGLLERELGEYK